MAFDTMVASYLLEAGPAQPQSRRAGPDLSRTRKDQDLRADRHGQESEADGRSAGPPRGRLCRPKTPGCRGGCGRSWPPSSTKPAWTGCSHSLELPLIDVLVELEYNGIKVDVARLGELSRRYGQRMETLEAEIQQMAGRPLNIASPKQLAAAAVSRVEAAGGQARAPRPAPAPTPRCSKSWPGCTRCRPRSSSTGSTPSSRARTSMPCPR